MCVFGGSASRTSLQRWQSFKAGNGCNIGEAYRDIYILVDQKSNLPMCPVPLGLESVRVARHRVSLHGKCAFSKLLFTLSVSFRLEQLLDKISLFLFEKIVPEQLLPKF